MELQYVWLIATGLAAGLLGGLLGIGGSCIMIPAMVLILGTYNSVGVDQIHQYMAAAMIANFLLALPSAVAHLRNRAVWPRVLAPLAGGALVGIIVGVQTSYLFSNTASEYLRWALGVFFLYVAGQNAWRLRHARRSGGMPRKQVETLPVWRKLIVGVLMGLSAGLLGLGGGTLAVPAQQTFLKMPLRNSIATSSATIAAVAWFGAILKNAQLGDNGTIWRSFMLVACIAPAAMIAAWFGGHLTHKLPLRVVRVVFIVLMLASAAKMFGLV
ncbi:MAG: sulfite exporter TauE/SafE family protein [Planctomycetota bacterium]|nr:sulfite exporter TauE/SafE family protein [Planctomycetota bacterium]